MIVNHEGNTFHIEHPNISYEMCYGSPVQIKIDGFSQDIFYGSKKAKRSRPMVEPKDVIFNDPATIVLWEDKTKTVVKCQPGDEYDPLIGFLLCVCKKFCGNKGAYNNMIRKVMEAKHER